MPKTKKPKTHFEQVPLDIVKEIADEDIQDDEVNGGDVVVEPPKKSGLHSQVWVRRGKRPSNTSRAETDGTLQGSF